MKEFVRVLIPEANNNRYLVVNEKRITNKWNFPGGKVELGETCLNACKREIYEETSLRITKLDYVLTMKFSLDGEDWIGHYFFARKVRGRINLFEQKSIGFDYITPYEIIHHKNRFVSAVRSFLEGKTDGL